MLLSAIISRRAGEPFATLVDKRLFAPLGMNSAHVGAAPEGVQVARGHSSIGAQAVAWTFDPSLAGVGGVRASLNDLVAYLRAQMGLGTQSLADAVAASQRPIESPQGRPMAMGWMIAPLNDAKVLVHEGGTGGFSSFVAFRQDLSRGVIVLSDTAMSSLGGLGSVGLHLLDERIPLGAPRTAMDPPAAPVEALVGAYRLPGGLRLSLRRKGQGLEIQADGQPAFQLGYDSAGDFFPLAFDAVLRPQLERGRAGFLWLQGGGVQPAARIEASPRVESGHTPLSDYIGGYALMPSVSLRVFVEDDRLKAQATGQGDFELAAAGEDVFRADAYGIEIRFVRNAQGLVDSLELHQTGQVLKGRRGD